MRIFSRRYAVVATAPVEPLEPTIIHVDLDAMNEAFDRSAGRHCLHCDQFGSHHTEAHNEFAQAVLDRAK